MRLHTVDETNMKVFLGQSETSEFSWLNQQLRSHHLTENFCIFEEIVLGKHMHNEKMEVCITDFCITDIT